MKRNRRKFLSCSIMASGALVTAPPLKSAVHPGTESVELAKLRKTLSRYSNKLRVVRDSERELSVVCEIADLQEFSRAMPSLVRGTGSAQADGNRLRFEQNGRRIQIEHTWNA